MRVKSQGASPIYGVLFGVGALWGLLCFSNMAWAKGGVAVHEPPTEVQARAKIELSVDVLDPRAVRSVRLRFRRSGEQRYQKVQGFKKSKKKWTITIPASEVQPPFIEYFIVVESKTGRALLVFASPQKPHRLDLEDSDKFIRRPASEIQMETPPIVATQPQDPAAPVAVTKRSAAPLDVKGVYHRGQGKRLRAGGDSNPTISQTNLDIGQELKTERALFAAEDVSYLASSYGQGRHRAPSMVSVVGRGRIEGMGARDLRDILKSIPGLETAISVTGFDLVSVRGLQNDARILLLVDGQPLFNPYDGRNYWNIGASHIDRVEVIRGPGGALYGAGAFSAVVLVTTRKIEGIEARMEGGSFDTAKAGVSGGIKKGGHRGAFNGHVQYTTGPSLAIEKDALSEANVERSAEDMLTNASGINGGVTASYFKAIGEGKNTQMAARLQLFGERRGPYIGYFDTVGPDSQLNWMLWSTQAELKHRFSPNTELQWKIYGGQNIIDRLLQLAPEGFSTPDRNGDGAAEVFSDGVLAKLSYQTFNLGTDGHFSLKPSAQHQLVTGMQLDLAALPENNFMLLFNRDLQGVAQELTTVEGLDMPQNEICRFYGAQEVSGLGVCRLTLAAFVQEQWQPVSEFSGTLGLRFTSFSDLDFGVASGITPRFALVWEPLSRWVIKALAATSFRAPTFEEKYDRTPLAFSDQSTGVLLGNEALTPEVVTTVELGTGYNINFGRTRYDIFVNSFASQMGSVIEQYECTDVDECSDETGTLTELKNKNGYDVFGVEGETRLSLVDGHFLFLNASWQRVFWGHEEMEGQLSCRIWPWEDATAEECTLITDVPQLRANLGAYFNMGSLGSMAIFGHTGSTRKNNWRSQLEQMRVFEIRGYTLANAVYHSPEIGNGFRLRVLAKNLLQEEIKDPVPRPDEDRMPGLLPKPGFEAFAQLIWEN